MMAIGVAPAAEAAEGGDRRLVRLPVKERWRKKEEAMAAEGYVRVLLFHEKQHGLSREKVVGG